MVSFQYLLPTPKEVAEQQSFLAAMQKSVEGVVGTVVWEESRREASPYPD